MNIMEWFSVKKEVAKKDAAPIVRVPTLDEKRKAAMALNLCATSISHILATDSLEVMDVEYQAILNNLNLENMVKDEALLSAFKSILDTVTFYRLQAGDRKRADVRYRQKLNNAIWSASSQGACILFASATNPTPWAAVSAAVMAVGAFCNVNRARADATIAYEDEKWKLERSLIEQLHALRYSLFETAWRLAERYDFEDAWRLTIPQIEKYNQILEERDPAWRYFKLSQYKKNFEAYPYYWYELGESAFMAALKFKDEADKRDDYLAYVDKAYGAFRSFRERDLGLLREDMVGAAARLRLVQIEHLKSGSWAKAVDSMGNMAEEMRGLACSAPDLITQCAICYASAYEESKDAVYLQKATSLMELVVCQDYNVPNSSRLLSKLYFEAKSKEGDRGYWNLMDRYGESCVVGLDDKDGMACLKCDRDGAYERLQMALSRQFVVAVKASNDGLFNGWGKEVDAKVGNFLAEKGLKLDASVQSALLDLWDGVKPRLNECFFEVSEKFALPIESVTPVATKLDAVIQGELKRYSGSYGSVVSSKDRVAEQHRGIYRAIAKAKSEYIQGLADVLTSAFDSTSFADVTALSEGTAALERSIESFIQKRGIVGVQGVGHPVVDVFSQSARDKAKTQTDCKSWTEYQVDPSWGEAKMNNHESFRVKVDGIGELLTASRQLEKDLERKDFKVRVYTKGGELGAVYGPTLALLAVHRIWTMNPDYEVIRYPKSIEVRYMHVDIHDASDDQGIADAVKEEVASATNQVTRVANEAWDCVGDAFNAVKGWFS